MNQKQDVEVASKPKHDEATRDWLYPKTCAEALARWDKGEGIFTIEMGGIGPGYEQAIQILVFELIRDNLEKPLPYLHKMTKQEREDWSWHWGDETVSRCDQSCGGFSGAQVGAAKQVAYRALRDGWRGMIESVPDNRRIQVSKAFPRL